MPLDSVFNINLDKFAEFVTSATFLSVWCLLTISYGFWYLVQIYWKEKKICKNLKFLGKSLKDCSSPEVFSQRFEELDKKFSNSKFVEPAWQDLKQSLITYPETEKNSAKTEPPTSLFSSQASDDFLTAESIVEAHLDRKLYSTIPNLSLIHI